jgi:hypothetical protein
MNHREIIDKAVFDANEHKSKLPDREFRFDILDVYGMSSRKNRHLFNNLINFHGPSTRYLEIGVCHGSTYISALYQNTVEYTACIDNFIEYAHSGPKENFLNNYSKNIGGSPNLFEKDCFNFDYLASGIKDINIYFYDGRHKYEDQRDAIMYYKNALSNEFILIVDDFDIPDIKKGTFDGLQESNININYKVELNRTKFNDRDTWWNGLLIAHCIK